MPIDACAANPFVSLVHRHDPDAGIDLDVLSASARLGPQGTGAELVVERVGVTAGRAQIVGELLAADVELGTRNPDGSRGVGIGAGVVLGGVEATFQLGHDSSLSIGASVGLGLHLSVGFRDADHDGKPALCARIAEFFALAGCIEIPF
jgi:hypothetical protein